MNVALWLVIALVGGTVHTGDGPPMVGATVLMENGKIKAVGSDIPIPAGARQIDARGKTITPGFIDGWTSLGLVEIWGVAATNDSAGGAGDIRAAQRAADSYNPDSATIPIQRAHGVTTVMAIPRGGLLSGQPGIWDLGSFPPVIPSAGLVGSLGGRGDGSRGARFAQMRAVFHDALIFDKNRSRFEQNRFRPVAATRLDLEAVIPVARGDRPFFLQVNRRSDIQNALTWAQSTGVRLVLVGAGEAWLEAEKIARAKVGVILDPTANAPSSFDTLRARADAAAILHRAGVEIALSTFSTHNVRKLRQWAGNAVRAGLPHHAALRAVTKGPARLLGLSSRGSITAGMVANVVIWSGDPFEFSSAAEAIYIRGHLQENTHRQRALFERYRIVPATP
jgi:imidazolonepropionase-like amidohydrolase